MDRNFKLRGKRIKSLVFFMFAFTLAIFTFSVGKSASDSQRARFIKYDSKYNKILDASDCKDLTIDELLNAIKTSKVSLQVIRKVDDSNIKIKTYVKTDGYFSEEIMLEGEAFKRGDFLVDENMVIKTSTISEKDLILKGLNGEEIKLNDVGSSYDRDSYIVMPSPLYEKIFGKVNLYDLNTTLVISGDLYELDLAFKNIQAIKSGQGIKYSDYEIFDSSKDSVLSKSLIYGIIFITMINSIGISNIWVESKKKEIIMRKVVGATDFQISKMFFGELIIIATVSVILALSLQKLIGVFTGGMLLNLNITIGFGNVLASVFLTVIMAFVVAIPFLSDIKKIQPIEIIREE